MRCLTCIGAGTIMGGGMVRVRCPDCVNGKVPDAVIDKDSAGYKKAKSDMMEIDKGLTEKDAEEMIEKESKHVRKKHLHT